MQLRRLGRTELKIAPLVLGGNVFGWTADRDTSFAMLDAFLDAGFNAIDTADVYNRYAPGLVGGESETLLGEWMRDRGVRERVVLITKGGLPVGDGLEGLGRDYLPKACEASLRRLQTDYIDVYMAHRADPDTPIAETLQTFDELIAAGKIRYAGCSNYTTEELAAALRASAGGGARYEVFEPRYNLVEREAYEGDLETLCAAEGLGVVCYYSLAAGFLTGKYRSANDLEGRARSRVVQGHLTPHGLTVLDAVETVAERHGATPAQVALAWLMARPSVTAPIASASQLEQLPGILAAADLKLNPDDFAQLETASARRPV